MAAQALRRAYVGLGSNLDDPLAQLHAALAALSRLPATRVTAVSRFYRTPPWGLAEQPDFVNAAAALETALAARELLLGLQAIERDAGRARSVRWGPRVLDLDLLMLEDAVIDEPGLRLPHPRLHERAFVLVPLQDVAPGLVVPGHGPIERLLAAVDRTGIEALG